MTDPAGDRGTPDDDRATPDDEPDGADGVDPGIAGDDGRKAPDDEQGATPGDDAVRDRPNDGAADDDAADDDAADDDAADDDAAGGTGDDAPEGDEVEPVEVLVQLAREGEIDPWDIDIVEVTDAFLARLDAADLRTSARALFYASVLLRMKGDALMGAEGDEDDAADAVEAVEAVAAGPDPVAALETEMARRLDRKHVRGSPETLDELVRELRDHERRRWWKASRTYDTSGSPSGFRRGTQTLDYRAGDDARMDHEPTEDDVTGTAHAEDIEEVIERVRAALGDHYDAGRDEVLYAEIADVGGSRVETFLALLFLAHRGQVRLRQDDLFGDLWVQDPAATPGRGEAAAD